MIAARAGSVEGVKLLLAHGRPRRCRSAFDSIRRRRQNYVKSRF
jgi:hypothetical protein